jgi:hypothetical protein
LCEAPAGPFRQLTPDTFTRPALKLSCDKALAIIETHEDPAVE